MKFLNKMERKYGRYAIRNLHLYMIIVYGCGGVLGMISPVFYYSYLSLDIGMILRGQVWRLITYVIAPVNMSGYNIFWTVLKMYMFYIFGQSLINAWGNFRFSVYIFSGYLFNTIGAFIVHFIFSAVLKTPITLSAMETGGMLLAYSSMGMDYVYQTMFFAIAAIYPDTIILMSFLIPIKAKWIAILDGAAILLSLIEPIKRALTISPLFWAEPLSVVAAMLNFLIFFFASRNYKRISPANVKKRAADAKRRSVYKRNIHSAQPVTHRCAVCGRTPQDNPDLEFRFCSKCKGNYEYCNDHLFTHEHVK